jgi:hypothetical protein
MTAAGVILFSSNGLDFQSGGTRRFVFRLQAALSMASMDGRSVGVFGRHLPSLR